MQANAFSPNLPYMQLTQSEIKILREKVKALTDKLDKALPVFPVEPREIKLQFQNHLQTDAVNKLSEVSQILHALWKLAE